MRGVWWSFALAACGGGTGAWVELPDVPATGLETRFYHASEWVPSAEEAFGIRARCPRITRARATRETEDVLLVEVQGEAFDQIGRVGAILPDGHLAEIRYRVRPDGSLALPVACASCEVLLGVTLTLGRAAACTGPGRSLKITDRAIEVQATPEP